MRVSESNWFLSAVILLVVFLTAVMPVTAMINPSAGYCRALGYTYSSKADSQGNQVGYCALPNGQSVYAWEFLQGQTAQEYGYCAKSGYSTAVVNNSKACEIYPRQSCAVCVFPNGSAVEVTSLMNLDFREKICYGDTCRDPKDYPLPPPYVIPPSGINPITSGSSPIQPTTVGPTRTTPVSCIPAIGAIAFICLMGRRMLR